MKIIVLHGDNCEKSYHRLTKFIEAAKNRGWEIVYDDISLTPSLFGLEKLIIIGNLQILGKKEIDAISKVPGTLVIYKEGNIPQVFLKTLPKDTRIEKFELPKLIWNFLDNPSIKLLHKVIDKNNPIEFVFTLLCRRFRDLYWIKTDPKSLNRQSWQIFKLKRQSEKYALDTLKLIINKMAEIDEEVKTGEAKLLPALDLLFATKLK